MARPLSVGKRLKEIVRDFLTDYIGGKPAERLGKPGISAKELVKLTQTGRARAEKPTRDFDNFAYVQDLLANMPAAVAGIRQLTEDTAVDENGGDRCWTLAVKVDSISDDPSDAELKQLNDFKETAQKIFDDYALRTGIGYNAKHYIFKFIIAGDCFATQDISLDTETGLGRIECIRELPTWQMRVLWDETGQLQGYEQWQFINDRVPISWTIPAQMIHWKYHPSDYIPYGQTIFSHLRGRWEQFKLIELDTIAAIHTKSVDPEIHKLGRKDGLDRLSDEEVNAYRQSLLDNPTDINRFYVVREGEAEIEFTHGREADAVLGLLNCHRDFENRFVENLGIPGHISGNVKDVAGRHVSSSLDEKYARRVSSIRSDFTRFLRPSILLEFALHGINLSKPELYGARDITLDIIWPDQSESRIQRSKRVILEWSTGVISHLTALRQLGQSDPDSEIDQITREREAGDVPIAMLVAQRAQDTQLQISENGDQGKGVQTDGSSKSDAAILHSLLGFEPEDLRLMIKEELQDALSNKRLE